MGAEQCYRTVYRKWYARKFEGWKRHCSCELLSCLTLCDPMDCSLPGSSVHGLLQARALEWVAISFSRRSSQPRDRTWVSCFAGGFFVGWPTREAWSFLVSFLVFVVWRAERQIRLMGETRDIPIPSLVYYFLTCLLDYHIIGSEDRFGWLKHQSYQALPGSLGKNPPICLSSIYSPVQVENTYLGT